MWCHLPSRTSKGSWATWSQNTLYLVVASNLNFYHFHFVNDTQITRLVIDEQLNRVIAPFDQHYLIGLPWHAVRKGCPYARSGAGLDPHAECERIHLWKAFGDASVQVIGALGEGQLKLLRGLKISSPCNETGKREKRQRGGGGVRSVPRSYVFS